MSEDFFDSQSTAQEKPAETKTRKRRERPEPAAEAAPAKPDRKRRAKSERKPRKPRETKVSIGVAITAFAGLSEDEAKIVSTIAGKLGEQPKKSRERIVAALGNLFG